MIPFIYSVSPNLEVDNLCRSLQRWLRADGTKVAHETLEKFSTSSVTRIGALELTWRPAFGVESVEYPEAVKAERTARLNLSAKLERLAKCNKLINTEDGIKFADPKRQQHFEKRLNKRKNSIADVKVDDYVNDSGVAPEFFETGMPDMVEKRGLDNSGIILAKVYPPDKLPVSMQVVGNARMSVFRSNGILAGYVAYTENGSSIPEDCSLLSEVDVHGGITYTSNEKGPVIFGLPVVVSKFGFDLGHPNSPGVLDAVRGIHKQEVAPVEKECVKLYDQLNKIRELMPVYKKSPEKALEEFIGWRDAQCFPENIVPQETLDI